jgi:phosphoribosylformylglycinamidine synthase
VKAAVIVFPGSNCDRDLAVAFRDAGADVDMVWHKETALPDGTDIVGLPGGFSYGDYLRCGAIASLSPVMGAVRAHAERGGYVLGICNGFQVLCESGLLPGALMRNGNLRFVCKPQPLRIATTNSPFTNGYHDHDDIIIPIAHHDGKYVADECDLAMLRDHDRIAFTYQDNPNGSVADIAGVLSQNRRVLGMMPHPERAVMDMQGGADGARLFAGLVQNFA